jgi:RNA polymerase sigma-70 factor (ECF subfamily)
MEQASDLELIDAIGSGDEDAFARLFARWAPRLGPFLNRATGSPEAGEELLQEAFMRIIRAAQRFDPRGDAGAWIYRICANLAYSYWRRERRAPRAEADMDAYCAPASGNPQTHHERRAFRKDADDAIGRLPENQRLVFLLKVDRGLTYEEIGEILGCPSGTAKSRFHHAVLKLREALQAWRHEATADTPPRDVPNGGIQ